MDGPYSIVQGEDNLNETCQEACHFLFKFKKTGIIYLIISEKFYIVLEKITVFATTCQNLLQVPQI